MGVGAPRNGLLLGHVSEDPDVYKEQEQIIPEPGAEYDVSCLGASLHPVRLILEVDWGRIFVKPPLPLCKVQVVIWDAGGFNNMLSHTTGSRVWYSDTLCATAGQCERTGPYYVPRTVLEPGNKKPIGS